MQKIRTMAGHIQNLIAEGEHQMLDFKFEVSDSKKIARSLVAFANTDGGRLLIGVKDNGSISGIRSEEEKHMIQTAAQMFEACQTKVDSVDIVIMSAAVADYTPMYKFDKKLKKRKIRYGGQLSDLMT